MLNLPNPIDVLKAREEQVRKLIELLGERTNSFEEPKLILIGGYALRAFLPFARDTRDCDFALGKGDPWHIDSLKLWLSRELEIATEEKRADYAFLRCVKLLPVGRPPAKVSLDFMEGKVISRVTNQEVLINVDFLDASAKASVRIGTGDVQVYIPTYADYLLLKIVSARPSDVRDIAALVWKNGVPQDIKKRATKLVPNPEAVKTDLTNIIVPALEDKRFVDSWRGMFITKDFTENVKEKVLEQLQELTKTQVA